MYYFDNNDAAASSMINTQSGWSCNALAGRSVVFGPSTIPLTTYNYIISNSLLVLWLCKCFIYAKFSRFIIFNFFSLFKLWYKQAVFIMFIILYFINFVNLKCLFVSFQIWYLVHIYDLYFLNFIFVFLLNILY